jgi:hypothetical protein
MNLKDLDWNTRVAESLMAAIGYAGTLTQYTAGATDADGTTWVDLYDGSTPKGLRILKAIKLTEGGTWAGTSSWRVIDDEDNVIYPYAGTLAVDSGNEVDIDPDIVIPSTRGFKIQFVSDNAGDGAGETITLNYLNVVEIGA